MRLSDRPGCAVYTDVLNMDVSDKLWNQNKTNIKCRVGGRLSFRNLLMEDQKKSPPPYSTLGSYQYRCYNVSVKIVGIQLDVAVNTPTPKPHFPGNIPILTRSHFNLHSITFSNSYVVISELTTELNFYGSLFHEFC